MKEVDILREIALKCKNEQLKKMYQNCTIVGIPLNYSLFSTSYHYQTDRYAAYIHISSVEYL